MSDTVCEDGGKGWDAIVPDDATAATVSISLRDVFVERDDLDVTLPFPPGLAIEPLPGNHFELARRRDDGAHSPVAHPAFAALVEDAVNGVKLDGRNRVVVAGD